MGGSVAGCVVRLCRLDHGVGKSMLHRVTLQGRVWREGGPGDPLRPPCAAPHTCVKLLQPPSIPAQVQSFCSLPLPPPPPPPHTVPHVRKAAAPITPSPHLRHTCAKSLEPAATVRPRSLAIGSTSFIRLSCTCSTAMPSFSAATTLRCR